MELDAAGQHRKLQLQELEEIRNDAYESSRIYKEKTKAFHISRSWERILKLDKKFCYSILALSYFQVSYVLDELGLLLLLMFFLMVQLRSGA